MRCNMILAFLVVAAVAAAGATRAEVKVAQLYDGRTHSGVAFTPDPVRMSLGELFFGNDLYGAAPLDYRSVLVDSDNFGTRIVTYRPSRGGDRTVFVVPSDRQPCSYNFLDLGPTLKNRFPQSARYRDAEIAHYDFVNAKCGAITDRFDLILRYRRAVSLKNACVFEGYATCRQALESFRELRRLHAEGGLSEALRRIGVTRSMLEDGAREVLQHAVDLAVATERAGADRADVVRFLLRVEAHELVSESIKTRSQCNRLFYSRMLCGARSEEAGRWCAMERHLNSSLTTADCAG